MAIRYEISTPTVIGEVLDDEAIIVNLDSGAYYSLRHVGATFWSLLDHQPTAAELIQAMCQRYSGDPVLIADSITTLLAQAEAEQLIRTLDIPEDESTAHTPPTATASLPPFISPVLEKYTDMADLLLLDPIHEVDEAAGWPKPR